MLFCFFMLMGTDYLFSRKNYHNFEIISYFVVIQAGVSVEITTISRFSHILLYFRPGYEWKLPQFRDFLIFCCILGRCKRENYHNFEIFFYIVVMIDAESNCVRWGWRRQSPHNCVNITICIVSVTVKMLYFSKLLVK